MSSSKLLESPRPNSLHHADLHSPSSPLQSPMMDSSFEMTRKNRKSPTDLYSPPASRLAANVNSRLISGDLSSPSISAQSPMKLKSIWQAEEVKSISSSSSSDSSSLKFSLENRIWSTQYEANNPCEDRYATLTNVLLQDQPSDLVEENTPCVSQDEDQQDCSSMKGPIRLSVFAVMDGHGGAAMADYASKKLLPLLLDNIQQELNLSKVHPGVFNVNGETRRYGHEHDDDDDSIHSLDSVYDDSSVESYDSDRSRKEIESPEYCSLLNELEESQKDFTIGTHSERENDFFAKIIQKTFLELDQDWMNSDKVQRNHQTFLRHGGLWNSGACCLVNIVLQRMSLNDENDNEEYEPILYSSHTGDCRAALLSGKEETEHESGDEEEVEEEDLEEDDSVEFDNNSDEEEDAVTPVKRMFLNPFHNRPFKRRRMWSGDENDSHSSPSSFEQSPAPSLGDTSAAIVPRSRSPSPVTVTERTPFPKTFEITALTEDHTPYNEIEASLVRERCDYAPKAIAKSSKGGIQRVAGSLSVTRALGDAYLKTPSLSFSHYKNHVPFISALPEVSSKILKSSDRLLILASDGLWERTSEKTLAKWIGNYFAQEKENTVKTPVRTKRMRMLPTRKSLSSSDSESVNSKILSRSDVSSMIVSRILNKVCKKHRVPSLKALMSLPKGGQRRSKHDDITTLVVDLEGFIL